MKFCIDALKAVGEGGHSVFAELESVRGGAFWNPPHTAIYESFFICTALGNHKRISITYKYYCTGGFTSETGEEYVCAVYVSTGMSNTCVKWVCTYKYLIREQQYGRVSACVCLWIWHWYAAVWMLPGSWCDITNTAELEQALRNAVQGGSIVEGIKQFIRSCKQKRIQGDLEHVELFIIRFAG